MPGLRDEITNTFRRLSGRAQKQSAPDARSLEETVVATDLREGRQYGTYKVLRRLGTGGMGHVYLAIDTRLGRHAALKFLSPKLKSDPEMLARLQQEARTASSLNHPNILTIYDIDEAAGEPFIASEFVDGFTLRQALERRLLEPTAALDLTVQIVSALKAAHEAGVVHRDLKPGNVMVRPDGLVKVIDFGLAKFAPQGQFAPRYEPLSYPDSIGGTVQYMSPEQARGEEVDHRSDIWSLGVMLYEMLAQRKPFDGETESHVIVAILDQKPADLKLTAGIPTELARVAEKALAKDAGKRYQSAQEMLEALRPLQVSSNSRPSRIRKSQIARKRQRRGLAIGTSACVLVAGSAVWWWAFGGREMILGPEWFEAGSHTQVTHRGDVSLAALSPDGKQVAYISKGNGYDQLHLLNLETGAALDWAPYAGNTVGLNFSPDSSTVYYAVHDQAEWGKLYAVKPHMAHPSFVLDDVDGPIAFSPDGKEFAFRRRVEDRRTNHEKIIVAKKDDTGDQDTVLDKYNTSLGTRVSWSKSGPLAVNLTRETLDGDAPPSILVFNRQGQELKEYSSPQFRGISGPAWLDRGHLLAFTSFGPGDDGSAPSFVELATRKGEFHFVETPNLIWSSVTVSRDFDEIAAVTSDKKSILWVADAQDLDHPRPWARGREFESPTWTGRDTIAYSASGSGTVHLWQRGPNGQLQEFPRLSDCVMQSPAAAAQQHMIVFSSNCEAPADASNLWMLSGPDKLSKLTDHAQADSHAAISPDGKTVLYNSWSDNFPAVRKLSLPNKTPVAFTNLQARNPAIAPDGEEVACQVRENYDGRWRVAILSMRTGAIEKDNLPLPTRLNSVMRWSPTGDALDYVAEEDPANIWRLPLNGAVARPITHRHGDRVSGFAWSVSGDRLATVSSDIQQDVLIMHRRSKP